MSYTSGYAWESTDRTIEARIYLYNGTNYSTAFSNGETNTISNITIEQSLVSGKALSFGNTCSAQATVMLKRVTADKKALLRKGTGFQIRFVTKDRNEYYDTSRITVGLYFIDEIENVESREQDENGDYYNDITIKGYDVMYFTEKEYSPTITISESNPQTVSAVASDVITCAGITMCSPYASGWSTSATVTSYPDNATCREMLGYLAGLMGMNCLSSVGGTIAAPSVAILPKRFYNSTDTTTTQGKLITQEEQYMDEYTVDGNDVEINRVESGVQDAYYVYPSNGEIGNSVSYECPYITSQSQVQSILSEILTFANTMQGSSTQLTYTPMSIRWRGNPLIELGDFILVEDKNGDTRYCLVMKKVMSFDGGYSETYTCLGETEKSVSFVLNPTMRTIDRKLTAMEAAILEATETIGDVEAMQDGVFTVIPNTAGTANIGWKIESNADDHYILANKNGIGFSSNGGSSFNSAAIWIDGNGDGHIAGGYIVAGSVTTAQIDFTTLSSGFTTAVDTEVQDQIDAGGIVIGSGVMTSGSSTTLATALSTLTTGVTNASNKTIYCTCSTPATTAAKAATSSGGSATLQSGMIASVKFTYTNTASSPTLNIDGTGAKAIYAYGAVIASDYYWNAGDTVTFVYNGTQWELTDMTAISAAATASSDATTAYNLAENVNATIASWASSTDSTYIDGSKIYTGTITTEKLMIGWQAGNLASTSQWGNSSYSPNSTDYLQMSTDSNGNLQCAVIDSFTSTTKGLYSSPFYLAKGAKFQMSATFYVSGSSSRYWNVVLQTATSINGTYSDVSGAVIGRDASSTVSSKTYTVTASQYYRLRIEGGYLNTSSYIKNIFATYTVTGSMVVEGSITSTDGYTVFDLDNNRIDCASNYYKVRLNSGELNFYIDISGNHSFSSVVGQIGSYYNISSQALVMVTADINKPLVLGVGSITSADPYIAIQSGHNYLTKPTYIQSTMACQDTVYFTRTSSGSEPRFWLVNEANDKGILVTFNPSSETLWFTYYSSLSNSTTGWTHYLDSNGWA